MYSEKGIIIIAYLCLSIDHHEVALFQTFLAHGNWGKKNPLVFSMLNFKRSYFPPSKRLR